ncbi:hypothetical protein D3C83_251460 [compost metagenome]
MLPNQTLLFAGVELNPVPVMTTVVPAAAAVGLNDVIVCADNPAENSIKSHPAGRRR